MILQFNFNKYNAEQIQNAPLLEKIQPIFTFFFFMRDPSWFKHNDLTQTTLNIFSQASLNQWSSIGSFHGNYGRSLFFRLFHSLSGLCIFECIGCTSVNMSVCRMRLEMSCEMCAIKTNRQGSLTSKQTAEYILERWNNGNMISLLLN